jgi:hypothetical protein
MTNVLCLACPVKFTGATAISLVTVSPLNILMRRIKNKRIKQTPEEAKYWRGHSKHDKFMTIKEIKSIAEEVLPGTKVKRHLFWRYSLVWNQKV